MEYIRKFLRGIGLSENAGKSTKMSEEEIQSKKQKLVNSPTISPIFKLTVDCCDEIFEYLSLKDLHSFGQTCKPFQKVAGEYYQRNYPHSEKFLQKYGIYSVYSDNKDVNNHRTQTSCFNEYTNYFSHYYEEMKPLRYIQKHSHEFKSINHMYIVCSRLNTDKMKYLMHFLPKFETISINQCTLSGDFYEILLKFCINLKSLDILDDLGYIICRRKNPWLLKHYPKLEHLQLNPRYQTNIIDELSTFFQRNPKITSFSTNTNFLLENIDAFMNSDLKLKTLSIEITSKYRCQFDNVPAVVKHLNQLHEFGFYERLHLTVEYISEEFINQVVSLRGFKRLIILIIKNLCGIKHLHRLINLTELTLPGVISKNDIEILAINLVNLEVISIQCETNDDFLPFMRHSIKLRKASVYFNDGFVDLKKLNREREKLPGGRKVALYVGDKLFMETKWTINNGDINLNMVEMRKSTAN